MSVEAKISNLAHKISSYKQPMTKTFPIGNMISCGINTILCSTINSSRNGLEPPNAVPENHSSTGKMQERALQEIHSAMKSGFSGNLDNMPIILGNSCAEKMKSGRIRTSLMACPDSGATRSLCDPKIASSLGCKIYKEKIKISNASGTAMKYEGTAYLRVSFKNTKTEVPFLLSSDIDGRVIIGKHDLIRMRVLPPNFPQILPAELFDKVNPVNNLKSSIDENLPDSLTIPPPSLESSTLPEDPEPSLVHMSHDKPTGSGAFARPEESTQNNKSLCSCSKPMTLSSEKAASDAPDTMHDHLTKNPTFPANRHNQNIPDTNQVTEAHSQSQTIPISPTIPKKDYFPQKDPKARYKAMENVILSEFEDVISDSLKQKRMEGPPAEIHFKKGVEIKPLHVSIARPMPIHMKEEADKTLQKYISEGVIVPVSHPTSWLSPAFWVAKGDGKSVRLVTDFSYINKYIQRNTQPFASAADCLKNIPSGTKLFCFADCLSGYYQVPLSARSSELTTFLLPSGKYKYLSSPMGLANSSDEFLIRSDSAIASCKEFTIKLVDDLLIHARNEQELMDRIRKVMTAMRAAGITLSRKKFKIASSGKFGGMIVSDSGITPDPERISALTELGPPGNVREVRGWLGAIQQLNIYHPHLAHFLKPVQNLTRKDVVWNWDESCQKAFNEVNKLLKEHLHLKFYDPKRPAILMTDASFHGFGYTLLQIAKFDNNGRPSKFDLIMAGSRTLKPVETRYSVTEIEATGLLWALGKCNHFLRGAKGTECWVDHKPLVGLRNKNLAQMTTRLARIFEKLSDFDFSLNYVKGISHYLPDYLSRRPSSRPSAEDMVFCRSINAGSPNQDPVIAPGDKPFQQLLDFIQQDAHYGSLREKIRKREMPTPEDSDEIKSFIPVWSDLSIMDKIILLNEKIVIPANARSWILKNLHSGHQGSARTLAIGRVRYFWPEINRAIKDMCSTCLDCIRYLPSQQKEPLVSTYAKRPFEKLSTDVFECKGKKFLIIVDRFSSFPFCIPLQNESSNTVIRKFEQLFMDMCFTPDSIRSDSGTCYTGHKFQQFCDDWGIIHEPSSPHYKASNGHAEANVKKLKKLLEIHKGIYSDKFRMALNVLRSTPLIELSQKEGSEGPTPVQLLYGRQTRLPQLPSLLHCYEPIDWSDAERYKTETAALRRKYYDQNARSLSPLKKGQKVVLQNPDTKRWDEFGEVLKLQDTKRSYLIQVESGRIKDRNRRLLRPIDPL